MNFPGKIFSILCFLIFLATLSSCSKHGYQAKITDPVYYPTPPDTARIQFLTSYGNSIDITGQQSKFKTFVAGEEKPLPILKPYGLAIHQGKIFIADAAISGFEVIDLEKNTFSYYIPEGRGKLLLPINCFIDADGSMYVSDVNRKQIVIFNKNLEFKGTIGGDENFKPADVFVFRDTVFVTDPKNNRINVYNKESLQYLSSFPTKAKVGDDNWLYNPLNLFVSEGKIYITDFGHSRIKIFTTHGEFIGSVGSYGRGFGQLVRPKGIAVDRDKILFVVDAGFQNIQMFDEKNNLLMFFGGSTGKSGDMYLPAKVTLDYNHLHHFEKYVNPTFNLKYLIFVTNQYGSDKINVYGRIEPKF
ncbi:MAG: 6-bladed beta-propeller [Bacteroidota bacterium]